MEVQAFPAARPEQTHMTLLWPPDAQGEGTQVCRGRPTPSHCAHAPHVPRALAVLSHYMCIPNRELPTFFFFLSRGLILKEGGTCLNIPRTSRDDSVPSGRSLTARLALACEAGRVLSNCLRIVVLCLQGVLAASVTQINIYVLHVSI